MKNGLKKILIAAAAVEITYLILINAALSLPVTQTLVNQIKPEKFAVYWEQAWSWYLFGMTLVIFLTSKLAPRLLKVRDFPKAAKELEEKLGASSSLDPGQFEFIREVIARVYRVEHDGGAGMPLGVITWAMFHMPCCNLREKNSTIATAVM